MVIRNRGAGQVKYLSRSVEPRDLPAVQLRKQILLVLGDDVDEVIVQCFLVREGLAFEHGFFGQRSVAPPLGGNAAQVRRGIVLQFLFHDRIHLGADHDRVCGAGIGSGSHRRNVAGFEEEKSGRGGAASTRRYIRDDRDGRSDHLLDGLAHRVHEPARSIQTDEHRLSVAGLRLLEGPGDDIHRDRMDDAIHVHGDHLRRSVCRRRKQRQKNKTRKSRSHAILNIPQSRRECLKTHRLIRPIQSFNGGV